MVIISQTVLVKVIHWELIFNRNYDIYGKILIKVIKNRSDMQENSIHNSQQKSPKRKLLLGIGLIITSVSILGLILSAIIYFDQKPPDLDPTLDTPQGTSVTLTSRDLETCHNYYIDEQFPCLAFKAGIDFEPGLYTIDYSHSGDTVVLQINPNINNYLFNGNQPQPTIDPNKDLSGVLKNSQGEQVTNLFSAYSFGENRLQVENVPLVEDSYIFFTDVSGGSSFIEYAKSDTFTLNLIAQTEYHPFENESGKNGFYPIGKAINAGDYRFDTYENLLDYGGEVISGSDPSAEDFRKALTDGEFTLAEDDVFITYRTDIEIEVI